MGSINRVSDQLIEWLDGQSPWGRLIFQALHADRLSPSEVARRLGAELKEIEGWQRRIREVTQRILESAGPRPVQSC